MPRLQKYKKSAKAIIEAALHRQISSTSDIALSYRTLLKLAITRLAGYSPLLAVVVEGVVTTPDSTVEILPLVPDLLSRAVEAAVAKVDAAVVAAAGGE